MVLKLDTIVKALLYAGGLSVCACLTDVIIPWTKKEVELWGPRTKILKGLLSRLSGYMNLSEPLRKEPG